VSKLLRVAAVHTSFSLYWPARLNALSRKLQENGTELHVIEVTADPGPYSFARGPSLLELNGRIKQLFGDMAIASLKSPAIASRVWDALESLKPDVVVAGAIAFTPGATAVRWCRSRRRGVVVMDDARLSDVPRSAAVNAIKRRIYANVDAMFVPAPSHLDMCQFFGFDPDSVFYGVDVVDNERLQSQVKSHRSSALRRVRDHELPRQFFVGVGRQVPKKNWPFLIDAYAAYRAAAGNAAWDLVLVGEGPDRALIESQIAGAMTAGVHLLPFLTPDEISIVYAGATSLVLPSLFGETWGLVVNEAMACGLPVLVSDQCGCASTLVKPDVNGWTFSPTDQAELTSLLTRISSRDAAVVEQMGAASLQIIADWSLNRFSDGAFAAIQWCAPIRRGFASIADRVLFSIWKGRFRPT
jgi:1,2-diacylglycerol 3-alpha-glucosyltransferase